MWMQFFENSQVNHPNTYRILATSTVILSFKIITIFIYRLYCPSKPPTNDGTIKSTHINPFSLECRAQHFLRICTHTYTTPINNDLCPPMPTHSMTCAHPCYSYCAHVFKNYNIIKNITNNTAPMPTQNPWAWAPNVGLC